MRIIKYELGWHPQQRGVVKLTLENNSVQTLAISDSGEFNAIAAILRENPASLENGWIHSGPVPPGVD